MYYLSVFYGAGAEPAARVAIPNATDVLNSINELKAAFPGWQRIDVHCGDRHLFSVDPEGKTRPG